MDSVVRHHFRRSRLGLGRRLSKWVGLKSAQSVTSRVHLTRLVLNTVANSVVDLVLGFPAPIALALISVKPSDDRAVRSAPICAPV